VPAGASIGLFTLFAAGAHLTRAFQRGAEPPYTCVDEWRRNLSIIAGLGARDVGGLETGRAAIGRIVAGLYRQFCFAGAGPSVVGCTSDCDLRAGLSGCATLGAWLADAGKVEAALAT